MINYTQEGKMKKKYLADVIVQNGQTNDDCLHRSVFDVNVEMFRKNKMYNEIILKVIDYMILLLNTIFENYSPLKGISGANIGIPLNIVIVSDQGNRIFINPVIIRTSATKMAVSTNCGSVNLPEPIKKDRYTWIQLKWIDIKGIHRKEVFTIGENKRITLTLQHEIDHNKGILITD